MLHLESISLTKMLSHIRVYMTVQNIGLFVAGAIALSWVWGSVQTLQKNYQHQREVDANKQKISLMKLQNQNLEYQKAYLNSSEFLELEARERLGLAYTGEKLVILPSSREITDTSAAQTYSGENMIEKSNLNKWLDFLFRRHDQQARS